MENKGLKCRKEDLAQWASLGLKKAITPKNKRAGLKAIWILPLNYDWQNGP